MFLDDVIPLAELKPRHVYRVRGRNLDFGVWTGELWIGLREKFGEVDLDVSEVPADASTAGTCRATEVLGVVPDDVGDLTWKNRALHHYMEEIEREHG